MQESELRSAAGAYLAGELASEDAQAFERLASSDASVARELAFWRACRPALLAHGRPAARSPGPELLASLRRSPTAGPRLVAVDARRWAGWALAAACLVLLIGQWRSVPQAYYEESGAAVRAVEHGVDVVFRPGDLQARARQRVEQRPWLGVWTRPVRLPPGLIAGEDRAVAVVQVAGVSPAAEAGIRVGDLLLELAGCPMYSRWCINGVIEAHEPGGSVPVRYYRPETGEIHEAAMTLGSLELRQ
ncbi:MAG: PDZ domain-containing protein [Planctomycetota bacterium]